MSLINKKQGYLKGALILSLGGFISKILGAIYRIPLTAYLGGEGMGIYQMVYPLYCILLTISASGIPSGIARLISSGKEQGIESTALKLYGAIGLIGSIFMFAFAHPLAVIQGESAVEMCCKLLAPSVFFVSVLSVVRGYFQGIGNMYPTAITEVMEQVIKVSLGILLARLFVGNVSKSVSAAILAVTISELLASLYALSLYFGRNKGNKPLYNVGSFSIKTIAKFTVPLTLTAIALPVSQLAESIVIVNVLKDSANATAIYGIYSGCAITIINLPVSITYGLAAASIPRISPFAENGQRDIAIKLTKKSLLITLLISIPFAVALYVFAPLAVRIIFNSLQPEQKILLVKLVRIMSVNAVTLSLVQTSSACLTALGKPLRATITQWATAILKVALSAILIGFTNLGIVGAAISANVCYLVAVVLNFWYIIKCI